MLIIPVYFEVNSMRRKSVGPVRKRVGKWNVGMTRTIDHRRQISEGSIEYHTCIRQYWNSSTISGSAGRNGGCSLIRNVKDVTLSLFRTVTQSRQ
jgi:hypothetical protein